MSSKKSESTETGLGLGLGVSLIEERAKSNTCKQCVWCCVTCPVACCCFGFPAICCGCIQRTCGFQKPLTALPSSSGGQKKKIFFDGAGFASGFGLGVCSHLCEKYDVTKFEIYGVSGGCLAALCLSLNIDPYVTLLESGRLEKYNADFMNATPFFGALGNLSALRANLNDFLPQNAHELISNLYIVLSVWPTLGLRFRGPRFDSRDDIIDAVIASCSFPGFAIFPQCSVKKGYCYFDAGYQLLLTPPDPIVDLTIRPMPIIEKYAIPEPTLVITDQNANTHGHKFTYASSFIPQGSAVWPGYKPPPSFSVLKDLILQAKSQAERSALISTTLLTLDKSISAAISPQRMSDRTTTDN
mmetsp:Transcript_9690/g.14833  ORF Transcript_9690/g.14833 Transcript_9690/m.14833 type:complete len:357 (-) Transcript_9690:2302-3372(-)